MVQTNADKMAFPPGYSARRAARNEERARMDAMERECYLAELETKAFAIGYAIGREKGIFKLSRENCQNQP